MKNNHQWTVQDLANKAGVSRQAVTKWFGRSPELPRGKTLIRLANATTGGSLDALFGRPQVTKYRGRTEWTFAKPLSALLRDPAIVALQRGAGQYGTAAGEKAIQAVITSWLERNLAKAAIETYCTAFQDALRADAHRTIARRGATVKVGRKI